MVYEKFLRRFQSCHFKAKLGINGILGIPAQTGKEIGIFKKIFDYYADDSEIKIFEWGSGLSTIYYADYLRKKGVEFEWHSIDNNKFWHEKVKKKVKEKALQRHVKLYLKEFMSFWEKPGWGITPPPCGVFAPKSENEKAYIDFPRLLNLRINIVIIDARFRRHCIQTAKQIVVPEGTVIMHDAHKKHYHVSLDGFQYSKFVSSGSWYPFQRIANQLWIGSFENYKIFEVLERY